MTQNKFHINIPLIDRELRYIILLSFPVSPKSVIWENYRNYLGIQMASIGLASPWRFIWTKYQTELFDCRISFYDLRGFGIDLVLQMYPPEHD